MCFIKVKLKKIINISFNNLYLDMYYKDYDFNIKNILNKFYLFISSLVEI